MDGIMRFPSALKHEPAIDPWLAQQPDELRDLATTWFRALRGCGDDVRETMHDGWPTACVDDAAFAHVAVYRQHVSVYFFFGAELDDPARLLEGTGKRGRHVKLRPGETVDAAALGRLIRVAYLDMHARLRRHERD